MRIDVLGIGFDNLSLDQAADFAFDIISGEESAPTKTYVVTPNPEIVWLCRQNPTLRDNINHAGLVLPDGIGIIYGARILGTPFSGGRVPGIDFIDALFQRMAKAGKSVFLLGAKSGVAEAAGNALKKAHPGLIISGFADGYFTDSAALIAQINATQPDLLLVCLGAPKQELWMAEHLDRLNVPLCAGLGGSLDVFSGNVKRAPVFFQKLGLEWFYRIVTSPSRLKRSLSLPLFALSVFIQRLRN
ncbi:MAG: WecB/TagA/CpsF family glycosyltransferase [Oscillospiraceae bacterium]|nr:WecB/TagA/CpsF family glycosyltransferase [Oscillospiraceae bacterium]